MAARDGVKEEASKLRAAKVTLHTQQKEVSVKALHSYLGAAPCYLLFMLTRLHVDRNEREGALAVL